MLFHFLSFFVFTQIAAVKDLRRQLWDPAPVEDSLVKNIGVSVFEGYSGGGHERIIAAMLPRSNFTLNSRIALRYPDLDLQITRWGKK